MKVDVNRLFDEIGGLPQVEAIALGGSRATGRCDETSDYDVYVYIRAEGEITPQSYVCKSGTEILMNRENYYTTKWSGFYGKVIDVGEDLSQNISSGN